MITHLYITLKALCVNDKYALCVNDKYTYIAENVPNFPRDINKASFIRFTTQEHLGQFCDRVFLVRRIFEIVVMIPDLISRSQVMNK